LGDLLRREESIDDDEPRGVIRREVQVILLHPGEDPVIFKIFSFCCRIESR